MLICETTPEGINKIAPGYEKFLDDGSTVLDHEFLYLNRGKVILELFTSRTNDNFTYFSVEEFAVTDEQAAPFSSDAVADGKKGRREFLGAYTYSTRQEALDHATAKFQESAFKAEKLRSTESLFG